MGRALAKPEFDRAAYFEWEAGRDDKNERSLIDRAAKSSGKTRTDFILGAARRAAEEELLDRAVFVVSPDAYAEFLARLDAPPRPSVRLRRTMQTPLPWSKTSAA